VLMRYSIYINREGCASRKTLPGQGSAAA
jgi:hypothetical protein